MVLAFVRRFNRGFQPVHDTPLVAVLGRRQDHQALLQILYRPRVLVAKVLVYEVDRAWPANGSVLPAMPHQMKRHMNRAS